MHSSQRQAQAAVWPAGHRRHQSVRMTRTPQAPHLHMAGRRSWRSRLPTLQPHLLYHWMWQSSRPRLPKPQSHPRCALRSIWPRRRCSSCGSTGSLPRRTSPARCCCPVSRSGCTRAWRRSWQVRLGSEHRCGEVWGVEWGGNGGRCGECWMEGVGSWCKGVHWTPCAYHMAGWRYGSGSSRHMHKGTRQHRL